MSTSVQEDICENAMYRCCFSSALLFIYVPTIYIKQSLWFLGAWPAVYCRWAVSSSPGEWGAHDDSC